MNCNDYEFVLDCCGPLNGNMFPSDFTQLRVVCNQCYPFQPCSDYVGGIVEAFLFPSSSTRIDIICRALQWRKSTRPSETWMVMHD